MLKKLIGLVFLIGTTTVFATQLNFETLNDGTLREGYDETITLSPHALSMRYFGTETWEKSLINFDLNSIQGKTLNNAKLRINIAGFTSSTGAIEIYAFSQDQIIDLGDAIRPASFIGSYYPTTLGLGEHEIDIDATVIQQLLTSNGNLTLRFENIASTVNSQLFGKSSSNGAVLLLDVMSDFETTPSSDAKILDIDGDGIFDTVTENPNSLSVRTFPENLVERSVINFDLSNITNTTVDLASLSFYIAGIANNTSNIKIYGFNGYESINLSHASQHAEVLGEYNPTALGLGNTTINLNTSIIEGFLGQNLSLRFESDDSGANSQIFASNSSNPPILELNLDQQPANPYLLYTENFENYNTLENPENWLDTDDKNSLNEVDLFQAFDHEDEQVLRTSSTKTNIHAHYSGLALDDVGNGYEYTGRLKISSHSSGIGITFFSQYPNSDHYYRLRRYNNSQNFHLSSHGTLVNGDTSTQVNPQENQWYQFRFQVEDLDDRTEIRGSLWAEGDSEPINWQIDAYDDSASRLASGTIGVWSMGNGEKYWDDLLVERLSPPPATLTCPDFTNLSQAEATGVALDYGLNINSVSTEHSANIASGNVITQTPPAGESIVEGGNVELIISLGPVVQISVPSVIGLLQSDASTDIIESSLIVGSVSTAYNGTYPNGVVISQSPTANEMVFQSSSVDLTLSRGPTPTVAYQNDFSESTAGNPIDWLDSAPSNSMSEDDSLFQIYDIEGESTLGTSSTQTNIHSHFTGPELNGMSDYEYSGRLQASDNNAGLGITFHSQYPTTDKYYRLRRWSGHSSFHLSSHGTSVSGNKDSHVNLTANNWYRFRVQVSENGSRTEIKARIWLEGDVEPSIWQIDAYDDNTSRITSGTIGVWSMGVGRKYWDDLSVLPL